MFRQDTYFFSQLGTFIERADYTARILDVKYYILLPDSVSVGSNTLPPRRLRIAGRYFEKLWHRVDHGRDLLQRLRRAELEEEALELVDVAAPVAHETRWTATIRSSSTENGAGSGSRSDLLSTTSCGRSPSPAP